MAFAYKVTAHMAWGGVGGRPWRSTWEMIWGKADITTPPTNEDDLTPTEFLWDEAAVQPFVNFMRSLSLVFVYIDRITVSTWLPDTRNSTGDPESYGATEIKVFPVGLYGLRPVPVIAKPADLEQTLFIRRVVGSGRLGRLNLRGVLHSDDLETNAQGKAILAPSSTVGPDGANWLIAIAYLSDYIVGEVGSEALRMAMVGDDALVGGDGNVRSVVRLEPAGITTVNLTKRNKAPTVLMLKAKLEAKGFVVTGGS